MELRQLRYLIALAEEGSFTRAAQSASIAQPALSRQIQKLEAELGVPLVDRTTRRVTITPAGQEVVATSRRVLGELDSLRHSLELTTNLLQGAVTIGVTQTPGPMNVPRLLATFSRQHSGVELIVREGLSVDLAEQLREDKLELALISAISSRERRQLELQRCRVEQLALLLPTAHRLAKRKYGTIADLQAERFVSFSPGATIREAVERAAARSGFVPRASIETNDVERTAALVGEGLGVAVLPDSDARRGWPNTAVVPLRAPTLRYEIFVARRAHRHLAPAAEALRTAILEDAGTEE
jgi:LysR family transcriptional regulator, transcription activator of glutamate synthase operon